MTENTRTDPAVALDEILSRAERGNLALDPSDISVLRDLASEIEASRQMATRMAEWIRARADLALSRKPDPEQPGHEEFSRGWNYGSYNTLHAAANAVEDGRAALPRDRWPPYMRGERILRPSHQTETTETSDGKPLPSA